MRTTQIAKTPTTVEDIKRDAMKRLQFPVMTLSPGAPLPAGGFPFGPNKSVSADPQNDQF